MSQSWNPEEARVNISDHDVQHFQRYDPWKLGFLQAPEIHLKEVTL